MGTPLERAAASVFMILLGYALKRAGFFSKSDADTVAKLCLNITLPAAIITGFGSYKQDFSLFAVIALGAVCNAVVLGVSWFMSVRSTRRAASGSAFGRASVSPRIKSPASGRKMARARISRSEKSAMVRSDSCVEKRGLRPRGIVLPRTARAGGSVRLRPAGRGSLFRPSKIGIFPRFRLFRVAFFLSVLSPDSPAGCRCGKKRARTAFFAYNYKK